MKKIILILIMIQMITLVSLNGCINNEPHPTNPPTANFTVTPSIPMIQETIVFNSTSTHPTGVITNYTWNMGDGTTTYGPTIVYQYTTSGFYNVSLQIIAKNGLSDSINKIIFVYQRPLLNNISLQINDLPYGYIKYMESYNSTFGFNFSIPVYELYNEQFIYGDYYNNSGYPYIVTSFSRFNTSTEAEQVLINSARTMNQTFIPLLPTVPIENTTPIGNQSIYRLFQGNLSEEFDYQNATWSYLYFRIQNITVLILLNEVPSSDLNYPQLTFNYAKIIQQRIILNLKN